MKKITNDEQAGTRFKIGDYVKRKPETVYHPEEYPPFFVRQIFEHKEAAGGFVYSEDDGASWTAQDVLELAGVL
jgi:hypothetical protein